MGATVRITPPQVGLVTGLRREGFIVPGRILAAIAGGHRGNRANAAAPRLTG